MFKTTLKLFYRNLVSKKLYVFINLLGMSLGIATLILVLLYFEDEKSYHKWIPEKENVFRILHGENNELSSVGTLGEALKFKEEIPEVKKVLSINQTYSSSLLSYEDQTFYSNKALFSSGSFFDFFPFKKCAGNYENLGKTKEPNLAISKKIALKFFPNVNDAIGKQITIENKGYTIQAVFELGGKAMFEPEVLFTYKHDEFNLGGAMDLWNSHWCLNFCLLKENSNMSSIEGKMDRIFYDNTNKIMASEENMSQAQYDQENGVNKIQLENLYDIRLSDNQGLSSGPEGSGDKKTLVIMFGLVTLIILISCVNFINFSISASFSRAKEVGIRKVMGSPAKSLVGVFILEVVAQCLMSLFIALFLAELFLSTFNELMSKDLSIMNVKVLLVVTVVTIIIGLITGLIPAFYLSTFKTDKVLKGSYGRSRKGVFITNTMLSIQFIISGSFLITGFVVDKQVQFISNADIGFEPDQIVEVFLKGDHENRYETYELIKDVFSDHHGVKAVSNSMMLPGQGSAWGTTLSIGDSIKNINGDINFCELNHLEFLGAELISGRFFSPEHNSDTVDNVIINETAAKALKISENPIDKLIDDGYTDGNQVRIIGVVKDINYFGFESKIAPMVFKSHVSAPPFAKNYLSNILFKLKAENIDKTLVDIEKFWTSKVAPNYPFEYVLMDKQFSQLYEESERQKSIVFILTLMVLFISALGLFALCSLTIQQKLKSIAIKKSLGATHSVIVRDILKGFVIIVIISILIFIPLTIYGMTLWLSNFSFRIDLPILPFIVSPVILTFMVLIIVGLKTYSASKVDVVKYLKYE